MLETIGHFIRGKVPNLCFAFFGQGVIQGWISHIMNLMGESGSFTLPEALTAIDYGSFFVYLAFLFVARKTTPLFVRNGPLIFGVALMVAGNVLIVFGLFFSEVLPEVTMAGLLASGVGSALVYLYWWEIYGALNPVEVALYYSGSCLLGNVIVFLLAGYSLEYMIGAALVLPFIGLGLFVRSRKALREEKRDPVIVHGAASFPWKPMLFLGFYGFAFGYGMKMISVANIPMLRFAVVIPAMVVLCSVLFSRGRFDFVFVYQFILPAAIVGLLVFPLFPGIDPAVATLCVRASYISVYVYVAIMLANLSRRYRMSAVWLFSMMGLVHIVSVLAGRAAVSLLASPIVPIVFIACVVIMTFMLVTESKLSSDWGIALTGKGSELGERAKREIAVQALAKKHGLTTREQEIVLMIGEGKMPRVIGRELHIAPGTVKAHVQHIYKKLGIHSKAELTELLSGIAS